MMQYRLLLNGLHDSASGVFTPLPAVAPGEFLLSSTSPHVPTGSPSLRAWGVPSIDAPWHLRAFLEMRTRANRIQRLSAPKAGKLTDPSVARLPMESQQTPWVDWASAVQQLDVSPPRLDDLDRDAVDSGAGVANVLMQVRPGAVADSSIVVTTQPRPRLNGSVAASQHDAGMRCEPTFGSVHWGQATAFGDPDGVSSLIIGRTPIPQWIQDNKESSTAVQRKERPDQTQCHRIRVAEDSKREQSVSVEQLSRKLERKDDANQCWSVRVAIPCDAAVNRMLREEAVSEFVTTVPTAQREGSFTSTTDDVAVSPNSPAVSVVICNSSAADVSTSSCEVLASTDPGYFPDEEAMLVSVCGINDIQDPRGWSIRTVASETDSAEPLNAYTQVIRFHVQMRWRPIDQSAGMRTIDHAAMLGMSIDVSSAEVANQQGHVDTSGVTVECNAVENRFVHRWNVGVSVAASQSWFQWDSGRALPVQRGARAFEQIVLHDLIRGRIEDLVLVNHLATNSIVPSPFERKSGTVLCSSVDAWSGTWRGADEDLASLHTEFCTAPALGLESDDTARMSRRSVSMVIPEQPATLPRLTRESLTQIRSASAGEPSPTVRESVTVSDSLGSVRQREQINIAVSRWQTEATFGKEATAALLEASVYRTSHETWTFGDGVTPRVDLRPSVLASLESSGSVDVVCGASGPQDRASTSHLEVLAVSNVCAAETVLDVTTPVVRFPAARGAIQLRFAQRSVRRSFIRMDATFAMISSTHQNAILVADGETRYDVHRDSRIPAIAIQATTVDLDDSVDEINAQVLVAGLLKRTKVADTNVQIVAPAFAGNRCTSCLVPQFHNSAPFASVSWDRVRRINRSVLAIPSQLQKPTLRATGVFTDLAIVTYSDVRSTSNICVIGSRQSPLVNLASDIRAELRPAEPRRTTRVRRTGNRTSASAELSAASFADSRRSDIHASNAQASRLWMQVDTDSASRRQHHASEACGVTTLAGEAACVASLREQFEDAVAATVISGTSRKTPAITEAVTESLVALSGSSNGVAIQFVHMNSNVAEHVVRVTQNAVSEIEPFVEVDRRRFGSQIAASFGKQIRVDAIAGSVDAVTKLNESAWGIGIQSPRLHAETVFATARRFAVGGRTNLAAEVAQGTGSLLLGNLTRKSDWKGRPLGWQDLAWHAAVFASPIRTAFVTSQLRSQLVGTLVDSQQSGFRGTVFNASAIQNSFADIDQECESRFVLVSLTPEPAFDVIAGLSSITSLSAPATFSYSTAGARDERNPVSSGPGDAEVASVQIISKLGSAKPTFDRWNRPRAA